MKNKYGLAQKYDNCNQLAREVKAIFAGWENAMNAAQEAIDQRCEMGRRLRRECDELVAVRDEAKAAWREGRGEALHLAYELDPLEPGTLAWWWYFWGHRPANRLPDLASTPRLNNP
ncbi:MAG: hypothetical protein U1E83_06800 [Methylotetracoccus sp.]